MKRGQRGTESDYAHITKESIVTLQKPKDHVFQAPTVSEESYTYEEWQTKLTLNTIVPENGFFLRTSHLNIFLAGHLSKELYNNNNALINDYTLFIETRENTMYVFKVELSRNCPEFKDSIPPFAWVRLPGHPMLGGKIELMTKQSG